MERCYVCGKSLRSYEQQHLKRELPDGTTKEVAVCKNKMCMQVAHYKHRVGKLDGHKNPENLIKQLEDSFETLFTKQFEAMRLRTFLHLVVVRDAREFGVPTKSDKLPAKERRSWRTKFANFMATFETMQSLANDLWPPAKPEE